MNGMQSEKSTAKQCTPGSGCEKAEEKLIHQKGNNGVQNHIGEMMTCRVEPVEVGVNTMGENGNRTVINEGFATQFSPVIRGKGVFNGIETTNVLISQDKLAISCHEVIGQGIPVYPHGYKSEED